ncbi:MAG: hypothetical protein ACM3X6_14300 [Patescibacteria group bacterium]
MLLWQRKDLGYAAGPGLLCQAAMLFAALIAFFLFQPILSEAPFAAADLAVVSRMGFVCFVPFLLFIRGTASK